MIILINGDLTIIKSFLQSLIDSNTFCQFIFSDNITVKEKEIVDYNRLQ